VVRGIRWGGLQLALLMAGLFAIAGVGAASEGNGGEAGEAARALGEAASSGAAAEATPPAGSETDPAASGPLASESAAPSPLAAEPARGEREGEAKVEAGQRPNHQADSLTIVLGGDLGLGGSDQPVDARGAYRHGTRHDWAALTAGVRPLIDGDVNFANLETIVTDRNWPGNAGKAFRFRSHPEGVRHLVGLGFNVFSTANNHVMDFGEAGARESIEHLQRMGEHGLQAAPGLGLGYDAASAPAEVTAKGVRLRVSAIGIGGNGLTASNGKTRPGMLAYHSPTAFQYTVKRLAEAPGDLRILSVHYGREMSVRPASSDVRKLRDIAVREAGIDIVAGHHAHVVAGVQTLGGKVVFYGLGNLLHPGMQDMGRFERCRDYGLLARVHYRRSANGKLTLAAIEAIPLVDMHLKARAMPAERAKGRIGVLNHLAAGLDDKDAGAEGVRFVPQADGSGLYCAPGAETADGRAGRLCQGWAQDYAALDKAVRGVSCGDRAPTSRRVVSGQGKPKSQPGANSIANEIFRQPW